MFGPTYCIFLRRPYSTERKICRQIARFLGTGRRATPPSKRRNVETSTRQRPNSVLRLDASELVSGEAHLIPPTAVSANVKLSADQPGGICRRRLQRQELHQPGPFLAFAFAFGPNENKAVQGRSDGIRLVDKQQSTHRLTGREQSIGGGRHRIHVMGDDDPTVSGGEAEHVRVRRFLQAKFPEPREFDGWLAAQDSGDDRVVQVIVGQEARLAHGTAWFPVWVSERKRATTGLGLPATDWRRLCQ